jgi:hypothetical protein
VERRTRRLFALFVLLPVVLAVHAYGAWVGGIWRVLAIADLAVGVFLILAMREAKRLDGAK